MLSALSNVGSSLSVAARTGAFYFAGGLIIQGAQRVVSILDNKFNKDKARTALDKFSPYSSGYIMTPAATRGSLPKQNTPLSSAVELAAGIGIVALCTGMNGALTMAVRAGAIALAGDLLVNGVQRNIAMADKSACNDQIRKTFDSYGYGSNAPYLMTDEDDAGNTPLRAAGQIIAGSALLFLFSNQNLLSTVARLGTTVFAARLITMGTKRAVTTIDYHIDKQTGKSLSKVAPDVISHNILLPRGYRSAVRSTAEIAVGVAMVAFLGLGI
jgi:hypothetical protein